jgi:hypothetical protein
MWQSFVCPCWINCSVIVSSLSAHFLSQLLSSFPSSNSLYWTPEAKKQQTSRGRACPEIEKNCSQPHVPPPALGNPLSTSFCFWTEAPPNFFGLHKQIESNLQIYLLKTDCFNRLVTERLRRVYLAHFVMDLSDFCDIWCANRKLLGAPKATEQCLWIRPSLIHSELESYVFRNLMEHFLFYLLLTPVWTCHNGHL